MNLSICGKGVPFPRKICYNKPIYQETVEDSCTYTGDQQKYITLDITRLVKDWYQNGNNNGLMLKDPYELSGYTEFLSADCYDGFQDMRPRIEISYVNYAGVEDYWSYHTQNIGRAGTAYVNDYNGNLILSHETLAMGGSLMPVSLSHVYNTNNRTENLGYGYGFRLNYHQTIEKVSITGTDYYKHVDGDGTIHYFYYDSEKKEWKDESGLDLVLTVDTAGEEPYVIKDKEENALVFNKSGYLIKVRDKNENTLTINYANNRITKLTDGAGTASVNTDAGHCKVGDQSLKAQCSSLTGYVYWGQSVELKKGETYTASMYAKASITQAAEDGGVFLRVTYKDKDNKSQLLESEKLKRTTPDFVQLVRTFTLPADASSNTVNVYLTIYHAVGTVYGDMAQLETGDTPSRCNLVDNGDFHLGSAEGFVKTGETYDGMISVGTEVNLPVQTALMVTASSAALRNNPSSSSATVATVTKNTHLAGEIRINRDGADWYRARTASGEKGYILASQAIPYLGGTEGVNSGAVGVTGAILRQSPSATGTPVLEYIPRGTSLAIVNTKTDENNKKWYYVGMQIDTSRYFGYLKEEQVICLCRNAATGTTKTQTSLYRTMSTSGTAAGSIAAGRNIKLRGTAVDAGGKKWYVVRSGMEFLYLPSGNVTVTEEPLPERIKTAKLEEGVGGLNTNIYKFVGDHSANKKLTKTLDISGKKGDTYMINAWGCGTALPETDNDSARRFGVEVIFVGADGKNDVHYTNFSPDILDWQFLSDVYVAKQAYDSIKISYTYCHNENLAWFDGLSLYREEYGQSYTYDEDNNLISVTDAQKQATKFEYNSNNDMTGIVDAKGNKFTYEYDGRHNVTKGTSAQGIVYKLTYDGKGNVLKSGCVDPSSQETGTWLTRTMTNNKNHIKSVTDAGGNTVQYFWNHDKDLMVHMLDGRGSKIQYAYDDADRLSGVSQEVTADGQARTVENTYTYTDDRLTAIGHNGFSYGFAYDGFGNTMSASVAGTQVVSYEYESGNGNLSKVTYGNGDYIRYTYDDQDRLKLSYYKSASAEEEVKLHEYVYDREGNLYQVTAHMAGKTYRLSYDLLDRLMRVTDEEGNSYTYTYDVNNCMVKMNHTCGTSSADTSYTYDKDSREVTTKCASSYTRTTTYDKFGRVTKRSWNTQAVFNTVYTYLDNGNNRFSLPKTVKNGTELLEYAYDANGNITSIKDSAGESTYQYDELNQLIRENNHVLDKTLTYHYDLGGNLTAVKEYAFTTEEALPAQPQKTETGTYSTTWKDQLLSWDGTAMTYDAIGNMLTKGSASYTWTQGRKLAGVENGKSIQYFYDHTGARTKKAVDGTVTEYRMAGDLLVSEKTGTQTYWYRYDSGANLVSVTIGGEIYFYVRNAQNDVIALIDGEGNTVVKYTYDSWGKVLGITGNLADTVGVQNPFRYRGYYYDSETGMYYLRSRYYDPELRRLISSDEMPTIQMSLDSLHNRNLYAYCNENPVMREDGKGYLWGVALIAGAIGAAVGAAVSVGTQMIVEGKSWKEVDKVDVGTSAISGAVATTAIGKAGQVIINAALGGVGSIIRGEDLGSVAFNTAVGAVSGFIGGDGADFSGGYKKYIGKFAKYSDETIDIGTRSAIKKSLRRSYITNTKRRASFTTKSGITAYEGGKLASATEDYIYSQYLKSLIVNYDQNRVSALYSPG